MAKASRIRLQQITRIETEPDCERRQFTFDRLTRALGVESGVLTGEFPMPAGELALRRCGCPGAGSEKDGCDGVHYTRKHGCWLNIAEIEIGVLSRQCVSRRIPDRETMLREVGAWQERRNLREAVVDWRCKTADARIKLKLLYPSIQ